jgi:Bardet-Biedl syndrome 4 protein
LTQEQAIASLKRALYLAPFEWIISFNLGLVHLNTGQYASAFHFFSASINLKPDFASTYMYLAITLNRLEDFDNACSAYEKALELEKYFSLLSKLTNLRRDHVFELNYAISLYNRGELEKSRLHFLSFENLFLQLDEETKNSDTDILVGC